MKLKSIFIRILRFFKIIRLKTPYERTPTYEEYWAKRIEAKEEGTLSRALNLERYIQRGESLYDVGCGDGVFMDFFRKKGVKVKGCDVVDIALDVCRKKGLDVENLDLLKKNANIKGIYDYVTCLHVFEHVQNPEIFLEKFRGKYKNGIFIGIPNIGFLAYRIRLLLGRFPNTQVMYHIKEHIRFWTVEDFKEWCEAYGFKVKKIISNDPNILARTFPSLFAERVIYWIE